MREIKTNILRVLMSEMSWFKRSERDQGTKSTTVSWSGGLSPVIIKPIEVVNKIVLIVVVSPLGYQDLTKRKMDSQGCRDRNYSSIYTESRTLVVNTF